MIDPLELRREIALLRMEVYRKDAVIDACNAYHGRVLAALDEALALARKHGASATELLVIRQRVRL